MTKLTILSRDKQRDFNTPSKLNTKKRASFFSLDHEMMEFIKKLRTPINQVGFVLQLGYFRVNGKFFMPQHFLPQDISHVSSMLGFDSSTLNIFLYQEKAIRDHRQKILELLQWQPLNAENQEKIRQHIQWTIPQQLAPKRVFFSMIEYCCHNKIEIPSYNFLANAITDAYNAVENNLILEVTQKLSTEQREKLDHILKPAASTETETSPLPSFTHLKKINQSLRPMDIRESASEF